MKPNETIVVNIDGDKIPVSSIWKDRKVVLVFLRQLGCRFCRLQISALMDFQLKKKLAAHDISLCVISLGSHTKAKEWLKTTGYDGELYLDEATSGDPRVGTSTPASLPYAVFRLKRGGEVLRQDNPEAQQRSKEVYNKFPDLLELGEKSEDGTVTIWPGKAQEVAKKPIEVYTSFCHISVTNCAAAFNALNDIYASSHATRYARRRGCIPGRRSFCFGPRQCLRLRFSFRVRWRPC